MEDALDRRLFFDFLRDFPTGMPNQHDIGHYTSLFHLNTNGPAVLQLAEVRLPLS